MPSSRCARWPRPATCSTPWSSPRRWPTCGSTSTWPSPTTAPRWAWIEPAYFRARHPEHAARDAIFDLGFTLTDPAARRGQVFRTTLQPIIERVIAARGVVAFDICAHNDTVQHMSETLGRWMSDVCEGTMRAPDVQTYYEIECHGPKAAAAA